jgi:hypothetical protein
LGCDACVATALATVAVGFGAVAFAAEDVGAACFTAGFGSTATGLGVGVAAVPASSFGRSRTTASNVGSGVGWLLASMSAFCDRGAPPPHAAHAIVSTIRTTAWTRVQLRMQGLPPS